MSDILKTFNDKLDNKDYMKKVLSSGAFDTSIDIICHETGETIFKGLKNKVVVAGSGFIARHLFDIDTDEVTPSYDEMLGLEYPDGEDTSESSESELINNTDATEQYPKVLLFCAGLDGCGTAANEVFAVKYKSCIMPRDLIPLRYPLKDLDLSKSQRQVYFGRVEAGARDPEDTNDYYAYYFKTFDVAPHLIQTYVADDSPVTEDIYDDKSSLEIQSYVEMEFSITKDDIREYFEATTGIDDARFNSISLCYAYPVEIDGQVYYKGIRPLTKLNIPNEAMAELTKGCTFVYRVFL